MKTKIGSPDKPLSDRESAVESGVSLPAHRQAAAGIDRAETGVMQFEGDWPGIFIRGDTALKIANILNAQWTREDRFAEQVADVIRMLRSCDARLNPPTQLARLLAVSLPEEVWQERSWTCQRCHYANLAVRSKCRNCGLAKAGRAQAEPVEPETIQDLPGKAGV